MQVILQGSLRHFAADELLLFVGRRTRSGTLDVHAGSSRARIFFDGEQIVWAEASDISDPNESVLAAFTWTDGTFTVLDSFVLPDGITPLALDIAALVQEARRRAEAAQTYPDETVFRVVDDPALQQQVSLTADEFKLLFRLATGKTFRELLVDLPVPRKELADRLKNLETIGLVAVVREEPPPMEKTAPRMTRPGLRKRTLVGSLTPDGAPDNVYPLLDSEYSIGRAADNAIPIPDGSVSSRHARILRTPEGFVLEDLQSRNGTFVNGERVAEKRLLADGDLIRLGKVIMTFNVAREGKAGEQTQPEVRVV